MAWEQDHLAAVDELLFRSELIKVGRFNCDAAHPSFTRTAPLDNDVFVIARNSVWIRRGAGRFQFLEPGGIVMHRADSELERKTTAGHGDDSFWFGLHPCLFIEALERHCLSQNDMGGALLAKPMMRYQLASLVRQLETGRAETLAVEESVLSHFDENCSRRANRSRSKSSFRQGTAARRRRLVDKARAFLDEHLSESIKLAAVASAAGTSLFHLCRIFREEMGLTLHAYRTLQRLGRAAEQMAEGRPDSLTELALDLGFSSHSHLCGLFQKHLGMAPSQLRLAGSESSN